MRLQLLAVFLGLAPAAKHVASFVVLDVPPAAAAAIATRQQHCWYSKNDGHRKSGRCFAQPADSRNRNSNDTTRQQQSSSSAAPQQPQTTVAVQLDTTLDDEKITALFAWISRAFDGDERYNNLMLAVAAVFGKNLPPNSAPALMLEEAVRMMMMMTMTTQPKDSNSAAERRLMGEPFSQYERESASLGAMGAAQWTGQWRTRPHALLSLHMHPNNWTSVQDWEKSLPRGCRRTLQRAVTAAEAAGEGFTVTALPIRNGRPAPHSSLAHFRCVVQHEVRLLTAITSSSGYDDDDSYDSVNSFLNALAEAVSRYMGTTRMAGEIREYRDTSTGQVIAFAHEVRKGRTVRGQWFYATNDAAKRYVWFHSVHSLVQRAIESSDGMIDTVDLGPSGSDDFSELKARYGFVAVDDWPAVADYRGPFWDYEANAPAKNGVTW